MIRHGASDAWYKAVFKHEYEKLPLLALTDAMDPHVDVDMGSECDALEDGHPDVLAGEGVDDVDVAASEAPLLLEEELAALMEFGLADVGGSDCPGGGDGGVTPPLEVIAYAPGTPPPPLEEIVYAPATPPADELPPLREDVELALRSGWFGSFRLTARPHGSCRGGAFGAWEVVCPFHRKSSKTGCAKYIRILGPSHADKVQAAARAVWWCTMYGFFDRQRSHMAFSVGPEAGEPPPSAEFMALKTDEKPERKTVKTDDELDADAAAEAASEAGLLVAAPPPPPVPPVAAAKAKAKPKAEPKAVVFCSSIDGRGGERRRRLIEFSYVH